jgi:hypothetical protein
MKTYSKNTEETLVTFHIGRGGRFNNPGFKSYCDQDRTIDSYTSDLFAMYENQHLIYTKIKRKENLERLFHQATEDVGNPNDAFYEFERRTGLKFGKAYYCNGGGNSTGLPVNNDGTGCIDEDGQYDTTIVQKLEDCNEDELLLIYESNNYKSSDVSHYVKNALLEANLIFEEEI